MIGGTSPGCPQSTPMIIDIMMAYGGPILQEELAGPEQNGSSSVNTPLF